MSAITRRDVLGSAALLGGWLALRGESALAQDLGPFLDVIDHRPHLAVARARADDEEIADLADPAQILDDNVLAQVVGGDAGDLDGELTGVGGIGHRTTDQQPIHPPGMDGLFRFTLVEGSTSAGSNPNG